MTERAVRFVSGSASLRGILHEPKPGTPEGPAIVFLHGWAGSRVGPHRMFVHAARAWCEAGCLCLRFDFAGRGDSEGAPSETTIASMTADVAAAIDFIGTRAAGRRVVLLGLCSGAKVAIAAAARTPRVRGLLLWSPEAMGELHRGATGRRKTLAALRAYGRKLRDPATWRKLFSGRVNRALVKRALIDHETPSTAEIARETRILREFRAFRGPLLLVFGTADPATPATRAGYETYCAAATQSATFIAIDRAGHNFTGLAWEREALARSGAWITEHFPARARPL